MKGCKESLSYRTEYKGVKRVLVIGLSTRV